MNKEGEQRFTGWIEKKNKGLQDELRRKTKVYIMNRKGELRLTDWIEKDEIRFTGWIEKEIKGLQDE